MTGSVGKTTTKDALKVALSACGPTHAAVSSFNNHWGVPLTLARMPRTSAFAVIEVGMNHAGEIETLIDMVRPHVAIITAIAESHIGHFEFACRHRRRQGGNLHRRGARRGGGDQPRQRVLRSPGCKGARLRHRRHPQLRRDRRSRHPADPLYAARHVFLHDGERARRGSHLQAGRAGPSRGAERTGRAGRLPGGRAQTLPGARWRWPTSARHRGAGCGTSCQRTASA